MKEHLCSTDVGISRRRTRSSSLRNSRAIHLTNSVVERLTESLVTEKFLYFVKIRTVSKNYSLKVDHAYCWS